MIINKDALDRVRKVLKENNIPPAMVNGRPFFIIRHMGGDFIIPVHGEIPKELEPYEG